MLVLSDNEKPTCTRCEVGKLTPAKTTFARWYGPQFVVVPNFNMWRCNICRHTEYDPMSFHYLELMFGSTLNAPATGDTSIRRSFPDDLMLGANPNAMKS